jgi:hypothetical protein
VQRKCHFTVAILVLLALLAVACSGTSAAPAPTTAPLSNQSMSPTVASQPAASTNAGSSSSAAFKTQTVDGGSVSVAVTPQSLKLGAPLEFDIAMNTHSVDLSNDMMKAVVLRDDAGKEYAPTAWDGPAAGGHHRSGKIEFAALTTSTRSIMLIVKNIAGVPERAFKWDLPQ